jgi:hypothetical protein
MPLEELNRPLVFLGGLAGVESSEVAALARLWISPARIESELT